MKAAKRKARTEMSATRGREHGQDHGHAQARPTASFAERDVKRASASRAPSDALSCATADPGTPPARGLYDPALDKDSCGVGFIADIKGRHSHQIVKDGLTILLNLEHRGAVGADPRAGDGAGILVQTPHKFFVRCVKELGFALPERGQYAVGFLFMPQDPEWRAKIHKIYEQQVALEGMKVLGWRDVPTDNSTLGESLKPTEPKHQQVFIARSTKIKNEDEFERRLYILRKTISGILYGMRERK